MADLGVSRQLADVYEELLFSLTPREEKILRMAYGLESSGRQYKLSEIAEYFSISKRRVNEIESKALRKLRHPSRRRFIEEYVRKIEERKNSEPILTECNYVIEQVKKLTPQLIKHLQNYENALRKINPYVFEHLIAEFFTSWGFQDVRLVG